MKIVLNMIVRDCAEYITKALDSTKGHVDYYVIGFAGKSSDNTEEVVTNWLKSGYLNSNHRPYTYSHCNNNWSTISFDWEDDFAAARNKVLETTKEKFPDADYLFWMDADDVLHCQNNANLHDIAEKIGGDCIQFPYWYHVEGKRVIVWHSRERLVNLKLNWKWIRPVHETLWTATPHQIVGTDDGIIIHDHTKTTNRTERNERILLRWLQENPADKRTKLYLGHMCYSSTEWDKGLFWFGEYFKDWENPLERWSAALFAGRCAHQLGMYEEAIGWYYEAINLYPQWKDAYIGLGNAHTKLHNYNQAIEFYHQADTKERPPSVLFVIEQEYDWNRWCHEHEALANTGKLEEALAICNKALGVDPEHTGFHYYYLAYTEAIAADKCMESIQFLCLTLLRRGDGLTALELLNKCVPANLEEEEKVLRMKAFIQQSIGQLWDEEEMTYLNKTGNFHGGEAGEKNIDDLIAWATTAETRVMEVIKLLKKHVDKADAEGRQLKIVDLACAGGGIPIAIAKVYPNTLVTGVDSDVDSISAAKKRAKEAGVEDRVTFVNENIFSLDIASLGQFDVALAQEIIEHTQDPDFIIGTCRDLAETVIVTCPRQLVVVPNPGQVISPKYGVPLYGHVREYSRADLEVLASYTKLNLTNLYSVFQEQSPIPGYGSWVFEAQRTNKHDKWPVVFFCGAAGGEPWTPHQIDSSGLGGSETAAIRMAQEFAKGGYLTIVYGSVDGVYDGVIYRRADKFNPQAPALGQPAWLFISSRIPDVFDTPINSVVKYLWSHDNTYKIPALEGMVDRLTPSRAENIDKILVLSEWHKGFMQEQYPWVPEDKWLVTNNGISVENFIGLEKVKPKQHSFIWASSLDRGLERVLGLWPKIREVWPDATLDIYYGLDVMAKIHGHIPEVQAFMENITQAANQEGIEWKGRIGQHELAKAFSEHQYWFYPTAFEETFCIVAEEAQAAGCVPITTNVAALAERVPSEYRFDWKEDNETEIINHIKKFSGKRLPKKYIDKARSYTWENVYNQWVEIAAGLTEQKVKQNAIQQPKGVQETEDAESDEQGAVISWSKGVQSPEAATEAVTVNS